MNILIITIIAKKADIVVSLGDNMETDCCTVPTKNAMPKDKLPVLQDFKVWSPLLIMIVIIQAGRLLKSSYPSGD